MSDSHGTLQRPMIIKLWLLWCHPHISFPSDLPTQRGSKRVFTEVESQTLHLPSNPPSPCELQDREALACWKLALGSYVPSKDKWRRPRDKESQGTSTPQREILALTNTSLKPYARRANFSGRRWAHLSARWHAWKSAGWERLWEHSQHALCPGLAPRGYWEPVERSRCQNCIRLRHPRLLWCKVLVISVAFEITTVLSSSTSWVLTVHQGFVVCFKYTLSH